jgi:hypothetical protein
MRRTLVLLALSACAEPESPAARLDDLVAATAIHCGGYAWETCFGAAPAQQALECMNEALTSGARAAFGWGSRTTDNFAMGLSVFTVDHQVKVFEDYFEGDGTHDMRYAVEQPTCVGPFRLVEGPCPFSPSTTFGLVWDGC